MVGFRLKRVQWILALGLGLSLNLGAQETFPAPPVMAVYKWASPVDIPVYRATKLPTSKKKVKPAGYLAQGTKLIPCIVKRKGVPIPSAKSTPYVGYRVVYEEKQTAGLTAKQRRRVDEARRSALDGLHTAQSDQANSFNVSHDCPSGYQGPVINARYLVNANRFGPAFWEPKRERKNWDDVAHQIHGLKQHRGSPLDLVEVFHNSPHCEAVNEHAHHRRERLLREWDRFAQSVKATRPALAGAAVMAKHVDIVARTAAFEGDIRQGCSAYGLCEMDIIILSIKNRGDHPRCDDGDRQFGCKFRGDYGNAAASVKQYNIWDRIFTIRNSITSCYLRDDLLPSNGAKLTWLDPYDRPSDSARERYVGEQVRYQAALGRADKILRVSPDALTDFFSAADPKDIRELRHYYHPPAMGACFPGYARHEYMSAAYAKRGKSYYLVLGQRVLIDAAVKDSVLGSAYEFRLAERATSANGLEVLRGQDVLPGALLPKTKVRLGTPKRCTAYGVDKRCSFNKVERYRRTPPWLSAGKVTPLVCRQVKDRGPSCGIGQGDAEDVTLGGQCATTFMPVTRVP